MYYSCMCTVCAASFNLIAMLGKSAFGSISPDASLQLRIVVHSILVDLTEECYDGALHQ